MKRKIIITVFGCIITIALIFIIDLVLVKKNIYRIKQAIPQFHSGVEGCINAHLYFDTVINKSSLDTCFIQSIFTSGNLQSVNTKNLTVQTNQNKQGQLLSFRLFLIRSKQRKDLQQQIKSDFIDINELNYLTYRFGNKDVLFFEFMMSEALNSWISSYKASDIQAIEIDISIGRPGGSIAGELISKEGNKYIIKDDDWLIEANIANEMNYISNESDSIVLHGMWKNKNNNVLILDPAFAYSVSDSMITKSLMEKRLLYKY